MLGVADRDPYCPYRVRYSTKMGAMAAMRPVGGRDGSTSTANGSKWGRGHAESAGPGVREVPRYR